VSDEEDWRRARAGDGEAFGRIYDRHRDRVTRHSVRLVPTWADADDVVAITFMESWRRRESVRFVDGSALPWLLVTATNAARNLSRGARRYRALLARLPASDPAPDHAERFDDSTAVEALRSLSLADRQVVTLCILEGFTEREAAAALGVAPGTIKSRLSRAKKRLAERVIPSTLALAEENES